MSWDHVLATGKTEAACRADLLARIAECPATINYLVHADEPYQVGDHWEATAQLSTLPMSLDAPAVEKPVPKCPICGSPMIRAGIGMYPYPCQQSHDHPGWMVWTGCKGGHTGGWIATPA